MKTQLVLLGAVLSFFAMERTSDAQLSTSSRLRNNIINRPTVSPYLNLLNGGGAGSTNYQTLVRPLLDQRRLNQTTQQQFGNVNQQLQTINAQQQRSNTGPGGIRATGHRTYFQNYSHFYIFQQRR